MTELWLVLRLQSWFWLVAFLTIWSGMEPLPMLACIVAFFVMGVAGYCLWDSKDQ